VRDSSEKPAMSVSEWGLAAHSPTPKRSAGDTP